MKQPAYSKDTFYNNDFLVTLVAQSPACLKIKSPRDSKVLDAMRKVDRKIFLDDIIIKSCVSEPDVISALAIAWREIELLDLGLVTPITKQDPGKPYRIALMCIPILLRNTRILQIPASLLAYNDFPLPIGYEQGCTQPSLVALMNDLLELKEGQRVLEIGTGCGYHSAVTLELIGPSGKLTTLERIPELAAKSKRNLENHFGSLDGRIDVVCADGSKGWKDNAPYDRIYLTAGVKGKFDLDIFFNQINKTDGVLVVPEREVLRVIRFKNGELNEQIFGEVNFLGLHS